MGELSFLRELAIIFAIAVTVVTVLHRIKIPSIAGFILAGILVGPHGIGFVKDIHQVEVLAEVGVILLLFSIGSEFSLERLRRLWKPIVIGGALQVGLTILLTLALGLLFDLSWRVALFIGFMIAVSSTAIVLRGLESRGETDAPHGRLTIGILLFQDLSVVPMMFAIPLLSGTNVSTAYLIALLLRAVLILCVVLAAARLLVPPFLHMIARTRQRDLFVLAVLLVCIGTAWAATMSGVSLALGAFMAGLVVAGSAYRHQALAELIPFREGFTSLFFISIGMLLIPHTLLENLETILLILVGILIGKFGVVFLTGIIMRLPLRVCVMAAMALAQVGEFSFVLARAAQGANLFEDPLAGNVLAAVILSMVITPFAISYSPHLAAGVGKIRVLTRLLDIRVAEDAAKDGQRKLRDHVIIGGYGLAGTQLANALKKQGIPYVIGELNAENVHRAIEQGEPAYFADITSSEVLHHLGAERAREFVIVINDPGAIERAVEAARRLAPNLHILVRTRYMLDVDRLVQAGANVVIADEIESAELVVSRVVERVHTRRDG
ncbi:MAG: hypothetical protein C4527_27175 [Candidatus Omnitrophota bacterium]|jgi:CPA2 family monovalent cation:H+ antiporter-2|nr:MAG: hypothetical protein C4527_27175 [Candidatus Omnitrophota bacterium]